MNCEKFVKQSSTRLCELLGQRFYSCIIISHLRATISSSSVLKLMNTFRGQKLSMYKRMMLIILPVSFFVCNISAVLKLQETTEEIEKRCEVISERTRKSVCRQKKKSTHINVKRIRSSSLCSEI